MPKKTASPAEKALKKLRRKGKSSASAKLAGVIVDDLLSRPLRELAPPQDVAERSMELLAGLSEADDLEGMVKDRVDRWLGHMEAEEGTLRDWMPGDATQRLQELVAATRASDSEATLKMLDHEAMRGLVRKVLRETLSNFVKKLRSPVSENRLLSGVRKRASGVRKRAGRFASAPRKLVGGLGDGMMGAVSDEMERQMQRRVGDFVDQAVGGVLRRIADHVTDPGHQEQFGEMGAAVTDIILDTPSRDAAEYLAGVDRDALAAFVSAEIAGLVGSELLRERIEQLCEDELTDEPTLGEYLDRRNILGPWRDWALEVVAERTRALVATDAFETWLEALLA
jgi:hypothetical protein